MSHTCAATTMARAATITAVGEADAVARVLKAAVAGGFIRAPAVVLDEAARAASASGR